MSNKTFFNKYTTCIRYSELVENIWKRVTVYISLKEDPGPLTFEDDIRKENSSSVQIPCAATSILNNV